MKLGTSKYCIFQRKTAFFSGNGTLFAWACDLCPMQLHTLMGCDFNHSQSIDFRFPKGNSKPWRYQTPLFSRSFIILFCFCLPYFYKEWKATRKLLGMLSRSELKLAFSLHPHLLCLSLLWWDETTWKLRVKFPTPAKSLGIDLMVSHDLPVGILCLFLIFYFSKHCSGYYVFILYIRILDRRENVYVCSFYNPLYFINAFICISEYQIIKYFSKGYNKYIWNICL